MRPPDVRLFFRLSPDERGISLHISPAETVASDAADHAAFARAPAAVPGSQVAQEPVGALGLYHLTHLAAALAEAVGVLDVMERLADQIVPALGPQGLVLMSVEEGRLRIVGHRGHLPGFIEGLDGAPLTSDVGRHQREGARHRYPGLPPQLREVPPRPPRNSAQPTRRNSSASGGGRRG
ncbi:hypothetical protein ACFCZ1_32750 [Streptomyces sp. NPDC056224]|uniref:hypothetical protein n=1 Tax=Streptomyces sp. NPDC056224 TaxID=3345750 RepID=UPI0035DFC986